MMSGPRNRPTQRRAWVLAALLTAAIAMGGCSSHSSSTSSGAARTGAGSNSTTGSQAKAAAGAGIVAGADTVTSPKTQVPVQQRDIVRTATISLQAVDVDRAADLIGARATSAGGRIDGDDRNAEGADRTAQLVLRLPPSALDGVLAGVVRLGKETSRSVHGEDVTASRPT